MADPYLGAITMFAGTFAPRQYSFTDGQILRISQNESLFSLLGTNYGGDGRVSFGLPDMRGRIPVHANPSGALGLPVINQGSRAGVESVTLTTNQIPRHTHSIQASTNAATEQPAGGAVLGGVNIYTNDTSQELQPLYSGSIGSNVGGQSHNNMMPYCAIHFIIALQGAFPSRN